MLSSTVLFTGLSGLAFILISTLTSRSGRETLRSPLQSGMNDTREALFSVKEHALNVFLQIDPDGASALKQAIKEGETWSETCHRHLPLTQPSQPPMLRREISLGQYGREIHTCRNLRSLYPNTSALNSGPGLVGTLQSLTCRLFTTKPPR